MLKTDQTKNILEYILPFLKVGGQYSRTIQSSISLQPEKNATNLFAAALSDADLSVQSFIEVALLARYPSIRFFGEEYATSLNTKYFKGTTFGAEDELLAILDPIDGTRLYLDQRDLYHVLFGLMSPKEYQGAIATLPGRDQFFYAIRGQGAYRGDISTSFQDCERITIAPKPEAMNKLLLASDPALDRTRFESCFAPFDIMNEYTAQGPILVLADFLMGNIAAAVIQPAQFLDGALLSFIIEEAGALATDLTGAPLPPAKECSIPKYPGIALAANRELQTKLLGCLKSVVV